MNKVEITYFGKRALVDADQVKLLIKKEALVAHQGAITAPDEAATNAGKIIRITESVKISNSWIEIMLNKYLSKLNCPNLDKMDLTRAGYYGKYSMDSRTLAKSSRPTMTLVYDTPDMSSRVVVELRGNSGSIEIHCLSEFNKDKQMYMHYGEPSSMVIEKFSDIKKVWKQMEDIIADKKMVPCGWVGDSANFYQN